MLALLRTSLPRNARIASRATHSRASIAVPRRISPATRTLATLSSTQNAPSLGSSSVSESLFAPLDAFAPRHLGPRSSDVQEMLQALGYDSIESFVDDTIPPSIRLPSLEGAQERLPKLSESELLQRGNEIGSMNVVKKSLIGMGYYNTKVPPVIQRNVSLLLREYDRSSSLISFTSADP
jgi:glycine dehydrogenase